MKKILITLIAAVTAACALFSFAACDEGNFSTQSTTEHGDSSLSTDNEGQQTPDDNEGQQILDESGEQQALTEAEENKTVETSGGIYEFLDNIDHMLLSRSVLSSHIALVEDNDEIEELTAYFDGIQFKEGRLDFYPLTGTTADVWQVIDVSVIDSDGQGVSFSVFKDNSISACYNDQYYYAEANSISEEFRELVYSKYCPR